MQQLNLFSTETILENILKEDNNQLVLYYTEHNTPVKDIAGNVSKSFILWKLDWMKTHKKIIPQKIWLNDNWIIV